MGDKKTTGVLVVLTSCGDPSKEDAFNKWYNDEHIPEILATGCYYAAYRYENTRPKDDQPKYLALYETDWDDPVDAFKELRKRLKGRISLTSRASGPSPTCISAPKPKV